MKIEEFIEKLKDLPEPKFIAQGMQETINWGSIKDLINSLIIDENFKKKLENVTQSNPLRERHNKDANTFQPGYAILKQEDDNFLFIVLLKSKRFDGTKREEKLVSNKETKIAIAFDTKANEWKIFADLTIDFRSDDEREKIMKEINLQKELQINNNAIAKIYFGSEYKKKHKDSFTLQPNTIAIFAPYMTPLNQFFEENLAESESDSEDTKQQKYLLRYNAFMQILEIIKNLHAQGIEHKDIKLSNFLVEKTDVFPYISIKITDFGFAKKFGEDEVACGKPEYFAPWQVNIVFNDKNYESIINSIQNDTDAARIFNSYAGLKLSQSLSENIDKKAIAVNLKVNGTHDVWCLGFIFNKFFIDYKLKKLDTNKDPKPKVILKAIKANSILQSILSDNYENMPNMQEIITLMQKSDYAEKYQQYCGVHHQNILGSSDKNLTYKDNYLVDIVSPKIDTLVRELLQGDIASVQNYFSCTDANKGTYKSFLYNAEGIYFFLNNHPLSKDFKVYKNSLNCLDPSMNQWDIKKLTRFMRETIQLRNKLLAHAKSPKENGDENLLNNIGWGKYALLNLSLTISAYLAAYKIDTLQEDSRSKQCLRNNIFTVCMAQPETIEIKPELVKLQAHFERLTSALRESFSEQRFVKKYHMKGYYD